MWPLLDAARGSWYASSWTRAARVARRFRFALTINPSPCQCQCHAGIPGPGPLENGPCPRPAAAGLAGRASGAIAVACQYRALPRPERLRRPVPTGSAVTQCARCQRPSGASTGMPVLALWGREWQPIRVMMTETPPPGRSTQGSIGVRECHERATPATCTGLSGHRLVLVEL